MRVCVDSSIIVAAIASSHGTCAETLDHLRANASLVLSEFLLEEIARSLVDRIGTAPADTATLLRALREDSEIVAPVSIEPDACRDPNDLPVLGTAVAGRADLLLTVDKDLIALEEFRGIAIVKPGEYWRRTHAAADADKGRPDANPGALEP